MKMHHVGKSTTLTAHCQKKLIENGGQSSNAKAESINSDGEKALISSFPVEVNTDLTSTPEYCQSSITHAHAELKYQNRTDRSSFHPIHYVGANDFQSLSENSKQDHSFSTPKKHLSLTKIGTFSIGSSAKDVETSDTGEFATAANTETFPFHIQIKSNDIHYATVTTSFSSTTNIVRSFSSTTNIVRGNSNSMLSKMRELCTCMFACHKNTCHVQAGGCNSFDDSCKDNEDQWSNWEEKISEINIARTCSAQSQTPSDLFTVVGQVKTISFLTQMSERSSSSSSYSLFSE
jgi:hypothetical protein